jgi:multimeric flavodoxin WrbA
MRWRAVESEGAKTKLYNLDDLDFTGCISWFACKQSGKKSYGHCALKDDLAPILEKIEKAGAVIIGSPICLGITTGVTRCSLERLIYPYLVYDKERSALFPKKDPDRVHVHSRCNR